MTGRLRGRVIGWRASVLGVGVVFAAAGCAGPTDSAEPASSATASLAASSPDLSTSTESSSAGSSSTGSSSVGRAEYVHLGDSYASGTGVAPIQENSPFQCIRSSKNFAQGLAAERGLRLTDVSCAGADTSDLVDSQYFGVPPQLDALGSDTRLVTMMLGGNDNNIFSSTIRRCRELAAGEVTGSPCRDRYGMAMFAPITEKTYPSLVTGLRSIKDRAPNARVIIVGYPWIMPPTEGCYPDMPVAVGDVPFVREMQSILNDAVRRAAAAAGVEFVDMAAVSEGHDACQPVGVRWIEPMTTTAQSSLSPQVHPNSAGQQAIADQVADVFKR